MHRPLEIILTVLVAVVVYNIVAKPLVNKFIPGTVA